ncbi:MAG: right-handed parallel beta-helix repeat-containing protein [Kiritimatiellae bacterium]|jgi:hypothetical protein|nr:right-handed parallel beta-helix repeat-containing protein [Kiritimatiellia bacterium]
MKWIGLLFTKKSAVMLLATVMIVSIGCREFSLTNEPPTTRIYVSPNGSDAHSGKYAKARSNSNDGPLASLTAARNAVRQLKADGQLSNPVKIIVADGTYTITEPLSLTPEDSGSATTPISYEAARGANPIISGGRVITGWTQSDKGLWTTKIDDVAAGKWYFEQLYINGNRATRARHPNQFYMYMQDVYEEVFKKGKRTAEHARQTIKIDKDEFEKTLGQLSTEELKDVQMQIYHKWDNTWRFIKQVDEEKASIITEGRGMMHWNNWHSNTRFHLENFRAALDAPGEWFLARNGTLFYYPLPGEKIATAKVVAPTTKQFLVVAGDPANGKFVEHITFRGLNFRHAEWITPPEGFEGEQAASSLEATLQFDGAKNINIENCEVAHTGIYAVWFRNACQNCSLEHCYIHDFGAGGVRIGQKKMPTNQAETTSHITFDNNIIRQGGYIFPCAVGVWIGFSGDNQVTHNEIADLFYTGISMGWNWGYGPSTAKRNDIGFNNVHHIGKGVLSDMGGIYTLGLSEGSHVHDNVFHDIYSYSYGGWGLYTDQASTGITFENNLVYNTKTGGFHQHFGENNIVRNNILAFAQLYQIQATRTEDHLSFSLENNIVYYNEGQVLGGGAWKKAQFGSSSNCYWNAGEEDVSFMGDTLKEWQEKGHEAGSMIADPKFADPEAGDFTLAKDSPALKIGFKPFDYSKAGVYGERKWKKLGAELTAPALQIAPEAPPLTFNYDFERCKQGDAPSGKSYTEGKGDSIAVTDETSANGKQSLKIVDAEGLKHSYNPHYVVSGMNYNEGRACNSFDLRVDAGANLSFEWRDYKTKSPYMIGLRLNIRNGRLELPGGEKTDLPLSKWVKFEIEAEMSEEKGSKWKLSITLPDGTQRSWSDLPFVNPECYKVDWIGFMSNAKKKTSIYLDNFTIHP